MAAHRTLSSTEANHLILDALNSDDDDDTDTDDEESEEETMASEDIEEPADNAATAGEGMSESESPDDEAGWSDVKYDDPGPDILWFNPPNQSGPRNLSQFNHQSSSIDYFKLLFTVEIVSEIVSEINRYADEKINTVNLSAYSRFKQWKPTDTAEFYRFLGVVLNMGIIRLPPGIDSYWSQKWSQKVPFFGDVISASRFYLLYHTTLHVCHSDPALSDNNKITSLISKLVANFQKYYTPYEEIAVQDSLIGFKGRVAFKVSRSRKPNKWGLSLKTLACPHTGYLLNAILDCGSHDDDRLVEPGLTKSAQTVIDIVSAYSNRGQHIYCDRMNSSIALAENLYAKGYHLTGAINLNSRGIPKQARDTRNMKRGNITAFRRGNILILNWMDKHLYTMISTRNKGDETMKDRVKGGRTPAKGITRPTTIIDYDRNTSSLELFDHYNKFYNPSTKNIKWWKKVFFWLLEASVTNAFVLRKLKFGDDQRCFTLLKFREELVVDLVKNGNPAPAVKRKALSGDAGALERLNDCFHAIGHRPRRSRQCRVCSDRSNGNRRDSTYYCATCSDQPTLHLGECFNKYHQLHNYRNNMK